MLCRYVVARLMQRPHHIMEYLNERDKQWSEPNTDSLLVSTMVDIARNKRDVIAETIALEGIANIPTEINAKTTSHRILPVLIMQPFGL